MDLLTLRSLTTAGQERCVTFVGKGAVSHSNNGTGNVSAGAELQYK